MMDFANKNVLVVGVGISGNAAAKLAKKLGAAKVVLSDASTLSLTDGTAAELIKDGLTFVSATNTAYKYDSESGKLVAKE